MTINNISIIDRIKEVSKNTDNPSEVLDKTITESTPEENLVSILTKSSEAKADLTFASLTIGDLVYDTLRIDPQVVESIEFARVEDLSNVFKFSLYANDLQGLPEASLEGHIDNIKGYVGERFVAEQLQSQGMEVEFPEDPNQEGFDLLVNGDQWQVKCVADKSTVLEHLDKNPDIPVFVNEEIATSLEGVPGVYPVQGFSLESIESTTRESIAAGDELLDYEIPFIAIAVAIGKNGYLMLNGKTDLRHGAINTVYDSSGYYVGGEIGSESLALVGALLGPYGIVVGGLIGAIGGGIYGRKIFSKVKKFIHTTNEEELLEKNLTEFLKKSYESSLKSKRIFENKVSLLINNLNNKGKDMKFLGDYADKRVFHERIYLDDKINKLKESIGNPRLLDPTSEDILIASINAITLSLRAKVHPHSVRLVMDNLVSSMKLLLDKRSKL